MSQFKRQIVSAGVQQLPAATPYALEALGAPSHALRRLGCQQLGAALPVSFCYLAIIWLAHCTQSHVGAGGICRSATADRRCFGRSFDRQRHWGWLRCCCSLAAIWLNSARSASQAVYPISAPLPSVSLKRFPPSALSHRSSQAVVLHAEVQDSRTWCPHKALGSS